MRFHVDGVGISLNLHALKLTAGRQVVDDGVPCHCVLFGWAGTTCGVSLGGILVFPTRTTRARLLKRFGLDWFGVAAFRLSIRMLFVRVTRLYPRAMDVPFSRVSTFIKCVFVDSIQAEHCFWEYMVWTPHRLRSCLESTHELQEAVVKAFGM